MTFISPIPTDTNGQPRQTGSTSLGKDDFLQLLVKKLQYQDPLNPMQDEDFIAQLAQFSSLEQMNNISDGISESNQWDLLQMQSLNNTMASGLIGKDIKSTYDGVYVDGESDPVINYRTSEYAQKISFAIKDADGNTVATLHDTDIEVGTHSIEWDGKDSLGNTVPEGSYTIEATATKPDGEEFTPSLSLIGTVSAISYRNGAAYLLVDGTEISLGDVTAVGEPGAFATDD
jgi:flagellar basal-body rod modification protein FlgD